MFQGLAHTSKHQKHSYSKCGLINIRNGDNDCFKHCLKYHQSKQGQNDIRLTSLSKVNN